MRKGKRITLIIILILLLIFGAVSVRGLTAAVPDNPIGAHGDSIKIEKLSDKSPNEDSEEADNSSVLDSSKKGEEKGKSQKNGSNQTSESKSKKPDVNEDSKDKGDNIDGMEDSDQASDQEGNGNTAEESQIPSNNKEASIVTDLKNQIITEKQLKNDTFGFYAYLSGRDDDASLKVKIRNDGTSINGKYLKSDGKDFETKLVKGYNYITLYLKKKGETIYQITYSINYLSDKADEDNPEVGEHPPVIKTNLDGRSKTIKNRNFIFTVSALTYKDKYLPYDNIKVTFDGKAVKTKPTGTNTYEYDLYFTNPRVGDKENHTVTVLAWDNEGNSTYKKFVVTYEAVEEGETIGTVTVNVDATTLGLGVIASGATYEIKQDEPASYAVLACMEKYGFTAGYSGTPKSGFYLKSLSAGYIASGAKVPSNLMDKIKDDGLNMTGQHNKNKISEFDYTEGSGWMYTIDGSLYPGRGLSNYYLEDGDVITLRFTLAYGKDLGAHSNRGLLSSYCGTWINGSYKAHHNMGAATVVKEATCTEDGSRETACKVKGCKEKTAEVIKALGHDYREVSRTEATESSEGLIRYKCSRCGDEKTETIPKKEPAEEPTKETTDEGGE